MSLRVWIWLLSLALLWGGSFFFAKVATDELHPLTVVFGRVALATLALNLALTLDGRPLFGRATPWGAYVTMGLLNNVVPFSLIFWGQTHIAVGLASILNATTPLFTLIVAHFLTADERLTSAKSVALLCGLAGVILLIGPDTILQSGTSLWGEVACLAAALSYAFAGIYGRRFTAMGIDPMDAATGQVTASAMLILPIMLVVDRPWLLPAIPSARTSAALVALGLLSTALGYVLYFRILAAAGATNLLLVTFLIPPIAVLLGAAFLGERLALRQFGGMALIGFGLAMIGGRIGQVLRPAK